MVKKIINFNNYNRIIKIILVCICLIIPFININKGLDITDTGYILNSYEFVFKNPETINFGIVFTSVFGNILLKLLNFLRIPSYLGFKLISCLFSLLICWVVVINLKKYFNESILLIGIIISLLLARGHISILMYTNLSAFILVISNIMLIKGLIEEKSIYIAISGALIGINIFVRISNLVQIILFFAIIYYGWKKRNNKETVKNIIIFFSSISISIITSVIFIIVSFGTNEMVSMLRIYFSEAINSSDAHSIVDSIKINLLQGLNGVFWIFILWIIGFLIDYLYKNKKFTKKNIINIYIMIGILPILFTILKYINIDKIIGINLIYEVFYSVYQPFSICVAFYSMLTLYFCFIKKQVSIDENVILLVGFLSMIALPMGSNQGFAILYQGFYLQGVMLSVFISRILISKNKQIHILKKNNINITFQKGVIIFIFIYFLCMLLARNISFSYRENSKLDKFTINNNKLIGIYTTEGRAKNINDLLYNIEPYIDIENRIITYGSIPIFSYILDMPPFFEGFNGWIEMGQLSIESMKNSFEKSEKEKKFPLIIISNDGTNNSQWPNDNTKKIMEEIKIQDNKYHLIQEYMNNNNYLLVYKNESFEVYYISD